LNDKFGTLKNEFEDWRDDGVIPLEGEVETMKAEVKQLQPLKDVVSALTAEIWFKSRHKEDKRAQLQN
jgi:hypothetical protein